jgi:ubiquinone/menaquinone biosynthesis C-methylase UbiE
MYSKVQKRLLYMLEKLHFEKNLKILDCGCGKGQYVNFLYENGFKNLSGIDISDTAIDKIKKQYNSSNFIEGNICKLDKYYSNNSFDVVVCFDVLYHLTNDQDFIQTLNNICNISTKYIILHGLFPKKLPMISCVHVKARPDKEYQDILIKNNFKEILSVPTHIITHKLLFIRLNKYFPRILNSIDIFLYNLLFKKLSIKNISSYQLKVFEKIT